MDGRRKRTHRDLIVWQRAMLLAESIYRITSSFPPDERFGFVAQMRRAAVSVPSNIAEGAARGTSAEYAHFLGIARGSLAELETQLALAGRLKMWALDSNVAVQVERVGQLLNALLMAVQKKRNGANSCESQVTDPESL